MKFETVRIYFLSEFSVCCHPKILLPWQRDVATSPVYKSDRTQNYDSVILRPYLLPNSFSGGGNKKSFPVCDSTLKRSAVSSFTPLHKSRCHNRSCVCAKAPSGIIFLAAQKLSDIVRTQSNQIKSFIQTCNSQRLFF